MLEAGDAKAASTFAVDVAGYYQSEEDAYGDFNGSWRAGFNFQNLGPKINYNAGVLRLVLQLFASKYEIRRRF
jgi:hypothetical protein